MAQKTSDKLTLGPGEELELPLPFHFKVLKELFCAVETVVGIMKGRKELIIFPKLKTGVTELFRKVTLREKHLAQMVTVFPGCYKFELMKVGTEHHIKLDVENLPPSVVCARRKAFHKALEKICSEHHQVMKMIILINYNFATFTSLGLNLLLYVSLFCMKKFLLSQVPPIIVPPERQITRWHPLFRLEDIPDITPDEGVLPVKPKPDKIASAREVIAKAQNILENANPRMKKALVSNMEKLDGESKVPPPQSSLPPSKLKALKGVSSSLLEKAKTY